MMKCPPSAALQRWCHALQEEERSLSFVGSGCAEEMPHLLSGKPPGLAVAGRCRAPHQRGARLPQPPQGCVSAPLTSAAAGTWRGALAACTGQGQGNSNDAVRTGTGNCCKQPQARPSTAQHSQILARLPNLAKAAQQEARTEPD